MKESKANATSRKERRVAESFHIPSVLSVLIGRWNLRHWKCQRQRYMRPQSKNATVYEWGSKVVVVGGCVFKEEM